MTVTITDETIPAVGWLMCVSDDEPDELREVADTLTRQVQNGLRGIPSTTMLLRYVDQARNRAKREAGEQTDPQRKMAFALANMIGLTRDDRLEFASSIVERDIGSWNDLSWAELGRVIDHMDGYIKLRHLRIERA